MGSYTAVRKVAVTQLIVFKPKKFRCDSHQINCFRDTQNVSVIVFKLFQAQASVSVIGPGLGELHVLSQIRPWVPRLVVTFRQILQVSALRPNSNRNKNFDFSHDAETVAKLLTRKPWVAWSGLRLRR